MAMTRNVSLAMPELLESANNTPMRHPSTLPILTLLLSPTLALAQPAPSGSTPPPVILFDTSSPQTEQNAAKANQAGKAAQKDGKLEQARELLAQAYSLSPNWKYAADLALVEIALERFRDAAEHLEFFLHHADRDAVPDEIFTKFGKDFDLAKSHVATITISVDEPGAEVLLDGKPVGVSPSLPVIYTEPGKHTISAKKTGFPTAKSEIKATAGSNPSLKLNLKRVNIPSPKPQPNPSSSPSPATTEIPTWIPWSIGGGLALVGLGLGAGFGVSTYQNHRDARSLQFEILNRRETAANPVPCEDPNIKPYCENYSQANAAMKRDNIISMVGFTVGGLAAAGTFSWSIMHYFGGKLPSMDRGKDTALSPILTTSHQGIQWSGTF